MGHPPTNTTRKAIRAVHNSIMAKSPIPSRESDKYPSSVRNVTDMFSVVAIAPGDSMDHVDGKTAHERSWKFSGMRMIRAP